MELRSAIQIHAWRLGLLALCLGTLNACMHKEIWRSAEYQKPGPKIWLAPIQGEGLAPGSAESLRAFCRTTFLNAGYQVQLDSLAPAQSDAHVLLHFVEFRYKRGLGEEPVAGLSAVMQKPGQKPMASLNLRVDNHSLNPWQNRSLSDLGDQICQQIRLEFLP